MKKLKNSKEKLKKQSALMTISNAIKREAPRCGLTVNDLISHYNRKKNTRCQKSYHEILNQTPAWLAVMRDFHTNTVKATRLGPDGENFYEPVIY